MSELVNAKFINKCYDLIMSGAPLDGRGAPRMVLYLGACEPGECRKAFFKDVNAAFKGLSWREYSLGYQRLSSEYSYVSGTPRSRNTDLRYVVPMYALRYLC